jgi:hypothetical protein
MRGKSGNVYAMKVQNGIHIQLSMFRDALRSPMGGSFIPQPMYAPHTSSDRERYVEKKSYWRVHSSFTQTTLLGVAFS